MSDTYATPQELAAAGIAPTSQDQPPTPTPTPPPPQGQQNFASPDEMAQYGVKPLHETDPQYASPEELAQHNVKAEGPGGTFFREAANAAIPTAASVGPMFAGGELGAELGAPLGPIGAGVGALAGAAIGGIAASGVVSSAQEKVKSMLGLDDSEQRAVNARANPTSAMVGQLAPMAVTFKVGNLADQIAQRLVTGGGMAGVDIAQQYAEKGTVDPTEVALQGAAGFALNKPRGFMEPVAAAGAEFGAKVGGGAKRLFPPGRPDMDSTTKDADLQTVSPIRPATSSARGAAMEQAPPDDNIPPSTLGDAKIQSSTPKSGDGGSEGRWAKQTYPSTEATLTTSDGTQGLSADPAIRAALPGQPTAEDLIAQHNAPGESGPPAAPPQGELVPPNEGYPRPFDTSAPFADQLRQLQEYGQQARNQPPQEPAGALNAPPATPATPGEAAIATSKKLSLPEGAPPMAAHLAALREAKEGKPTAFDAGPPTPQPKQTVQKTIDLLVSQGKQKLADRLSAMPEGPEKIQKAAQLAAAAGSNVTGKVPAELKNVRVRNPDKLADLDVEGYINPRTERPVRAKDFPTKYVNEAVHDINGQVHANPDLQPPEGGGETPAQVKTRAQAILDDALAKAQAKSEAMKTQADQMKAAADEMTPGLDKKSALARANAMKVAASRIGNGSLPVENYKMSGLDKPAEWRMQRHAKDLLDEKFPTEEGDVPPHEKFLADEALIRQGGDAYRTFVANNRAEAEAANKPAGKSDISTAEGIKALTQETPKATTVRAPVEATEPTSAAEHYETEADRRVAETREDRVNDKLYSQGHGKIVDKLQAMPIGEARDNNYIALENKLLKGKQGGPNLQPMVKPLEPLTRDQTDALVKKVDAQAKSVQEFVDIANGKGPKVPPNTPPKAVEAVKASTAAAARKTLTEKLYDMWNGTPYSNTMKGIIRERGGITAQILAKASHVLEGFSPVIRKMDAAGREDFMKAMDTGAGTTKELQPLADWWKLAAEDIKRRVSELPDHEKQEWVKSYFPHYFTDAKAADAFVDKWYAERGTPHEGSTASLEHRTFPTLQEGLDAGLKLASSNPLEIMGRYLVSMHNYIAQQEIINAAKQAGIVQVFPRQAVGASGNPAGRVIPENWVALKGRAQYGEPLYAPADAATIYNNYISRGFAEISPQYGRVADMAQKVSNSLTGLELSFNGYHFFTEGKEAIINQAALAMSHAISGDFAKALQTATSIPTAPVTLARTGATLGKVAMGQVEGSPEMNRVIDLAIRAGARLKGISHDPTYKFSSMGSFFSAWRRGNLQMDLQDIPRRIKEAGNGGQQAVQAGKEMFGIVGRTMQTVAEPLFQHYIPNLKNGAIYENLSAWLDAHPAATDAEQLQAARQVVDSVDNRFGEMVHDNIFWNKAGKQTAMIMMRAYSWFLGTAREIGGGTMSAFQNPERIALSHPQHDPRAAYAVTMPVIVALTSMLYQYLKTGEGPGDLRDLFVPKTGGTATVGGPERAALPGYEKDVYGWARDPTREAVNKLATAPRLIWDTLSNTDFKGAPIANANASPMTRMEQYAGHVLGAMNPISVKNIARTTPRGSNITLPERVTAIRNAPTWLENPERIGHAIHAANQKAWKMKVRQDVKAANRGQ